MCSDNALDSRKHSRMKWTLMSYNCSHQNIWGCIPEAHSLQCGAVFSYQLRTLFQSGPCSLTASATSKWNSGHQGTWILCSTWGRAECYVMCPGYKEQIFLFTQRTEGCHHNLPFHKVTSGPTKKKKKSWDSGHKRGPQTIPRWPLSAMQIKSKLKELRRFASYPDQVFLAKILSGLCLNWSERREGGPLKAQTIHGLLQGMGERKETSAFPYYTGVTKIHIGDLLGGRGGMAYATETVTLLWQAPWPGQVRKYGAAH